MRIDWLSAGGLSSSSALAQAATNASPGVSGRDRGSVEKVSIDGSEYSRSCGRCHWRPMVLVAVRSNFTRDIPQHRLQPFQSLPPSREPCQLPSMYHTAISSRARTVSSHDTDGSTDFFTPALHSHEPSRTSDASHSPCIIHRSACGKHLACPILQLALAHGTRQTTVSNCIYPGGTPQDMRVNRSTHVI